MAETPRKPVGTFNATKCAQYLRHIGVEVTDEQARSWLDMESVHRFLRSGRKVIREGKSFCCTNGHHWTGILYRRGSGFCGQSEHNARASTCPECGSGARIISTEWSVGRDGTVSDYRPESERWKPMESFGAPTEGEGER